MLVGDSGGGLPSSAFGIDIPAGDPYALETAASEYQNLVAALALHSETVASAGRVTLGANGWSGMAAASFSGLIERLIGVVNHNIEQAGDAATALTALSKALETAQTVTTSAMSDAFSAHETQTTQQQAATEAGNKATTAHQKANAAVHPAAASNYRTAATAAEGDQRTAQAAANQASGEFTAAQTRGKKAYATYVTAAQAATAKLNAVAGSMKDPGEDPSTLESVVEWVGHLNDFGGAASVGVIKGYDAAISVASKRMISEIEAANANPDIVAAITSKIPVTLIDDDPSFDLAAASHDLANSPLAKFLTKGLPEDKVGVLGKVPYLGAALTVLDMVQNRNEGVNKAVVEPVGNLVLGTVTAETTASIVAPALAGAAAGDGALATILGTSALIPGVGEVVIVGAVAVCVVAGADWLYEHPKEALHALEDAAHGIDDGAKDVAHAVVSGVDDTGKALASAGKATYHAAKTVVHDAEPWNW